MPKTGQPDASDAQVMIGLYEAQAAHNIGEVMGYLWSSEFTPDFKEFRGRHEQGSNSMEEQSIFRLLGYFETIGTMLRNNLINEDLVYDWLAIDMLWGRVKGFVIGVRREIGNVRMYENFEYMARRNANWKPARTRAAAATRPAAKRATAAAKRPAKRAATKRPAAKRATTKRAAPKRKTAKRPAAKGPAAKRATAAAKRPAAKKATAKRPAAKKATTKRPAAKKTIAAKKAAAKRPAAKRPAAKRAATAAKRPAAKRATARRPAAKKSA